MPIVNIKFAKGRTLDQKRELVSSVTQAIAVAINIDPQKIWIQLDEFDTQNFAIGGKLLSEK